MAVFADDPQRHVFPPSVALGVAANSRGGVVYDAQRVEHGRRLMATRVRHLVDARQRGEGERRTIDAHTLDDLIRHVTVDVEPAGDVAAEMRSRGAEGRSGCDGADPSILVQPATNHAQRRQTFFAQLEHRRRVRIEVAIHRRHLIADVAPRVIRKAARGTCAIEPAESGQYDRTWNCLLYT